MCSRIQKLTVVLASASPRRTELLEQGNIKHVVMPSHSEEVITSQVPSQVVEELSAQKAEDVYQQYEKKNAGDFLPENEKGRVRQSDCRLRDKGRKKDDGNCMSGSGGRFAV